MRVDSSQKAGELKGVGGLIHGSLRCDSWRSWTLRVHAFSEFGSSGGNVLGNSCEALGDVVLELF
jgi:hypothetical protein